MSNPHIENDTVCNAHLAAEDIELVTDVELRVPINGDRSLAILPQDAFRVVRLDNAKRGERHIRNIQHSVPADMDAVRVHEYEIAAARLIHCAEDIGKL